MLQTIMNVMKITKDKYSLRENMITTYNEIDLEYWGVVKKISQVRDKFP